MPIYEYKCEECEHIEEVLQKSTEGFYFLGKSCPNCGSVGNMSRMLSMGSFHLKGSGWYKDGYGLKQKQEKTTTITPSKTSDGVIKARSIADD